MPDATAARVLFVPATMPSHIIPLIALARLLNKKEFEAAFLVPALYHNYVRSLGFNVLNIDRNLSQRATPEMMAIGKFKPDVIVDDTNYTTAYATRLAGLPRISIVRRGIMPFEQRATTYKHSCPYLQGLTEHLETVELEDKAWKPEHYSELFIGDVNIIPSVASVETLPEQIENKSKYVYSGPLTLPDADIFGSVKHLPVSTGDNRLAVENFLRLNSDKKIVYLTMGLTFAEGLELRLSLCLQALLSKGIAVITNITSYRPAGLHRSLLFAAELLPMDTICSKASMMIHHCGSGTYNYQLSYKLPAIILDTQRYDRDEVAMRLHQLGAAHYIPADITDEAFLKRFNNAADELLGLRSGASHPGIRCLENLEMEIKETKQKFRFDEIVRGLLFLLLLFIHRFYHFTSPE